MGKVIQDINILKFQTKTNNCYVFDAITNNIYQVRQNDLDGISNTNFGRENGIRDLESNTPDIRKQVSKNAKTLIIEITEKCNLRCSYCVFDDESKIKERSHGKKSISLKEAKDSVSSFYERTNKEEAFIVFYGGEPLLEFEKIKDIVAHADTISNKKIKYSITTNGIPLNNEKLEFLIKNNFLITFSIDGPKTVNDKYRFKKNKKGVFEELVSKIESIKDNYPEYYSEKVLFNCVINNTEEIDLINKFFAESKIIDSKKVRFSAELSNSEEINKHISNAAVELFNETEKKEILLRPIEQSFIGNLIAKVNHRKLDKYASQGKKICVPFSNRTYIRSSGEIQFCERIQDYGVVSSTTKEDLELASKKIYSEFLSFKKEECSRCFAYNFCEFCPASFMENGKLNKTTSKIKCDGFRKDVKESIRIYIEKNETEQK